MKVSVGVWPYCPERHPAPSLSYFSGNGWNKKAISAGQRVKQPIPSKARLLYLYHYPEYPFCSTSHNSCLCWKRQNHHLCLSRFYSNGTSFRKLSKNKFSRYFVHNALPPFSFLYDFSNCLLITCYVLCSVLDIGSVQGAENSKTNKRQSLCSSFPSWERGIEGSEKVESTSLTCGVRRECWKVAQTSLKALKKIPRSET